MNSTTKKQIGRRLRQKREQAGYTREKLAELSSLSPRFIANIEFGDATFSLDSLMSMCRALSCGSDDLLFGSARDADAWANTLDKIQKLDEKYQKPVDKAIQGLIETIITAERGNQNHESGISETRES